MRVKLISVLTILVLCFVFFGCDPEGLLGGTNEDPAFPTGFPTALVKKLNDMGVKKIDTPENAVYTSWKSNVLDLGVDGKYDEVYITWTCSETDYDTYATAFGAYAANSRTLDADKSKVNSNAFASLDGATVAYYSTGGELITGYTIPNNSMVFYGSKIQEEAEGK